MNAKIQSVNVNITQSYRRKQTDVGIKRSFEFCDTMTDVKLIYQSLNI